MDAIIASARTRTAPDLFSAAAGFYPLAGRLVKWFGAAAALLTLIALARNARLAVLLMAALAPTGAMFTFVALWTGSLWGSATRGIPWAWDTWLTCELVLFVLYLAVLGLRAVMADPWRADRACAVLVLVGLLNIPIIYLSLHWWNTLHSGAAAGLVGSPTMARTMFAGMLVMALAFCLYAMAMVLARVRCLILEREADPGWLACEGSA